MGIADRTPPTPEEYADYRKRFSNWGRWGADDELGTLNFITPDVRRGAAALVEEGRSISLSRPIDTQASARNPYPAHHLITVGDSGGFVDYFGMFIHGFANTHVDALSHITAANGEFYNGRARAGLLPKEHTASIDFWRHGIVTRGVLYDIPRLRGTSWVEPGAPVHAWDLEDAARAQGIEPRPGDAVLIRSGFGPYLEAHPDHDEWASPAGVHASVCEFLHAHDAAALSWDMLDAPHEDQALPNPMPTSAPVHVHCITIPYMGMPLIDNADFEELAKACAELGRWEFQYVVAPLVLKNGTGSPVNPLAVL